ncbi:MAG TPA: NAD(+) synthase [Vicinamibacterales bacterium]|nr:NAD(+) synthase [Vicinamibacterales bacterium]
MSTRTDTIVTWLRDKVHATGARGFVFGLSGGIDSAVVGRLCQLAVPQRVLGVLLPCYSHPQDEDDARLVATTFSIPVARVDLGPTFDALTEALHSAVKGLPTHVEAVDIKQQLPEANAKPRLRMTSLYFLANSLNYLVAGTGNKSEITLGYYTKYGDGGVDVLPIGGLVKSEVRALARELGVPARVIDKAPTAGLWMGQTDEAEMGFTYDALEKYLAGGPSAVAPDVARRIELLRHASDHKRALPPIAPV